MTANLDNRCLNEEDNMCKVIPELGKLPGVLADSAVSSGNSSTIVVKGANSRLSIVPRRTVKGSVEIAESALRNMCTGADSTPGFVKIHHPCHNSMGLKCWGGQANITPDNSSSGVNAVITDMSTTSSVVPKLNFTSRTGIHACSSPSGVDYKDIAACGYSQ
jgi:hypothetical protein